MKYASRSKHKLNRVFQISYLSLTGNHFEYVKNENIGKVKEYADKKAYQYGYVVVDVKLSSLPKNLKNNEIFVDLI